MTRMPKRHSRQIRTKASTEPVALRVRPRPGNTAPTIPEPPTQSHSCIERSEAILTGNLLAEPLRALPSPDEAREMIHASPTTAARGDGRN
jgi:hypothetical protein